MYPGLTLAFSYGGISEQAVGEILPIRARHPYITPPFCRREHALLRRNYSLARLLST
jgi:hypothetical protein